MVWCGLNNEWILVSGFNKYFLFCYCLVLFIYESIPAASIHDESGGGGCIWQLIVSQP